MGQICWQAVCTTSIFSLACAAIPLTVHLLPCYQYYEAEVQLRRIPLPRTPVNTSQQRPKVRLSLSPNLASEKYPNPPRVLLEGGGGLGFFRRDYYCKSGRHCMYRVAHSVLKHRLGATSVAAFITKRAALLRSQRSVRLCFVAGG